MNNQLIGRQYEIQIRNYIINHLKCNAFLWSDTPENILIKHNLINSHNDNRIKRKENKLNPLIDTGVDIVKINNDDTISFVQCKNGYKHGLKISDLAGYLFMMMSFENINGYVYYTSKLSNNLTMQILGRTTFIKQPFIDSNIKKNINKVIVPFSYQLEAK